MRTEADAGLLPLRRLRVRTVRALGLGWESMVCPEAEIVERSSPAEGTARMRAEAGKGGLGSGPRGRTVGLEHAGCVKW